jgi:hypothetical protein
LLVAGAVLAAGGLLLLAGPAMADDSSHGAEGAGGSDSGFANDGPSASDDVTPGGVPLFGIVDSAKGAPPHVVPSGDSGSSGGGGY